MLVKCDYYKECNKKTCKHYLLHEYNIHCIKGLCMEAKGHVECIIEDDFIKEEDFTI